MARLGTFLVLLGVASLPAKAEFYVNPFAGMTIFDSTVTVGGTKLIDQGGDAINFGVRAGWLSSGPYFFGGEIEGNGFSGRSRAIVNGQTYNYALEWGVGAYGRVGWRTLNSSAFFARAGVLTTNQDTRPDFGVGAEVWIGNGLLARIDLGYAPGDVEFYRMTGGLVFRF